MSNNNTDLSNMQTHVDVNVPVGVAFHEWEDLQRFPKFMDGVQSVDKVADNQFHFTVQVGPKTVEYDANVTARTPDQMIAWAAIDGKTNKGMVTFQPLGPNKTRVGLAMQYETDGLVETVGDALGFVSRRAKKDLTNFKEFIENAETH